MTLLRHAAALVIGATASLGQTGPWHAARHVPPGMPPGAPFPPLMMPPLFVAGGAMPSPQEVCLEMSALRARGYFAYLRQRPRSHAGTGVVVARRRGRRWRNNRDGAHRCAALPAEPDKPGLTQALSLADRHLTARRRGLQRISAPLLKLYEGLSPA